MKFICCMIAMTVAMGSIELLAQEKAIYSAGMTGTEVLATDAEVEAKNASDACGYDQVYFTQDELESLLEASGSVGIRIYNGKQEVAQQECDLIAVAVDENGNEIGKGWKNKYMVAGTKKVSESTATKCVENIVDSPVIEQRVFFSTQDISQQLAVKGSTGITVVPGGTDGSYTMMISGASFESGEVKTLGDSYTKSALPCPTDCGDKSKYLVSPK